MKVCVEKQIGKSTLSFETGQLAKLAAAAEKIQQFEESETHFAELNETQR